MLWDFLGLVKNSGLGAVVYLDVREMSVLAVC